MEPKRERKARVIYSRRSVRRPGYGFVFKSPNPSGRYVWCCCPNNGVSSWHKFRREAVARLLSLT